MTKRRKKRIPVRHDYDIHMVWDADYGNWWGSFTWYQDAKAVCTITAVGVSYFELLKVLADGLGMVQAGPGDNQLVLPDMGDFQIRYHTEDE